MSENNMQDLQNTELETLIKKADELYDSRENAKEEEALKIFMEIDKKHPDNAYCLFSIGHCYEFGRGVEKSALKAKEYYEKAVELGSSGAATNLGSLYKFGDLGEVDIEKAKKYYTEGDRLGNTNSTKYLAQILHTENNNDCIGLYEKVLNSGDNGVLADLGNIYWLGILTVKNISKAQEYFDKVCELKDFEGMCKYAKALRDTLTMRNFEYYEKSKNLYDTVIAEIGDSKFAEFIKNDAELGLTLLSTKLEYLKMYNYALGMIFGTEEIEQNTPQALENLEKLSSAGITDASVILGNLYFEGNAVEQDYEKALEYFELAHSQGDYAGTFRLALMHFHGDGVDIDMKKAIEFAKKAKIADLDQADELLVFITERVEYQRKNFEDNLKKAEDGDISAITYVANAYSMGIGVEPDAEKATKYFEIGISKNDYKSMADYSFSWHIKLDRETFLNIDGKELLRARKLAEKVVAECPEEDIVNTAKKTLEMHQSIINMIIMEAQHCLHPFEDTDISKYYPERGLTLLEVLTEYENMVAPYLLGEYYSKEDNGALDYTKAKKYLEISIDRGYHTPKTILGKMYRFGLGVEENSIKAAQLLEEYIEVARKRSEQSSNDYISTVILLGMIYDRQLSQINKAIPYYKEAAQAGVPIAERILGAQYALGEGVERNFDTALFWLKKAVENGDETAAELIQNVYDMMRSEENEKSSATTNQHAPSGNSPSQSSGGCYVATCVYGSYDCPEVWTLRRYRDDFLAITWGGKAFIKLYYAISPSLVKWFGKTKWFQTICKLKLDAMVEKLHANGVQDTPYDDRY